MPEEQPPADPRVAGSDWSWRHPDADSPDADPGAGQPQTAPEPPAPETLETPRRALPRSEDFRRTVGFTVLGTIVPGVGLIAAGRRVVGSVVLALFVLTLAAIGVAAAVDRDAEPSRGARDVGQPVAAGHLVPRPARSRGEGIR